jgi:hypothetical protein
MLLFNNPNRQNLNSKKKYNQRQNLNNKKKHLHPQNNHHQRKNKLSLMMLLKTTKRIKRKNDQLYYKKYK